MIGRLDTNAFRELLSFHFGPALAVHCPEWFLMNPHDEDFQDVLREIHRARSQCAECPDCLEVELVREGNLAMCLLKRRSLLVRGLPIALIES